MIPAFSVARKSFKSLNFLIYIKSRERDSQPSRTLPCPKEGLQPPPKALPLARGRDATAPPRRSDTKVCSTHQRVGIVLRNIVAIVCAGKARPCGSRDFDPSPFWAFPNGPLTLGLLQKYPSPLGREDKLIPLPVGFY